MQTQYRCIAYSSNPWHHKWSIKNCLGLLISTESGISSLCKFHWVWPQNKAKDSLYILRSLTHFAHFPIIVNKMVTIMILTLTEFTYFTVLFFLILVYSFICVYSTQFSIQPPKSRDWIAYCTTRNFHVTLLKLQPFTLPSLCSINFTNLTIIHLSSSSQICILQYKWNITHNLFLCSV